MDSLLTEKNILLVGSSSGIGLSAARLLADMGNTVLCIARDKVKLDEAMKSLPSGGHAAYSFDVSQVDRIENLIDTILDKFAHIDGIVYCVGNGDIARLRDLSSQRLHAVMLSNFYAFIEFIRVVASKKAKKQPLRIVAVSSMASISPEKYFTAYAASKAAMDAAVKCLALELVQKNTTINVIRPGVVATQRLKWLSDCTGEINAKIKASGYQPLGCIPPDDVAYMIAFLLSEKAAYITGAALPFNGGATC